MKITEKSITLKNGTCALLRSPRLEDAEEMISFLKTVATETDFIMKYPEECTLTVEQEQNWIKNSSESQNVFMICCEVDGVIAGNCSIHFYNALKVRHRACVDIAIIQRFWNLGIGTAMFAEMTRIARERGVMLMELEVIEGNERARHLYEKAGFSIVSERPNSIRLKDGTMLSLVYMQKML